ncbi:unnamed protein product [Auanema sp. JU1783]|nr:unnamed protein product [Auanema sp. JU1783]
MFGCFKGCCGSFDAADDRPYEIPRKEESIISPVAIQPFQPLRNDGLAVSLCPPPKALCDGKVHSLLDHSSFDPPLCSTKLAEESRRSQSDTDLVKNSGGGTLSETFWNDIRRWDEKQKPKRRQTFGGVGSRHSHSCSSDFSTGFELPSYTGKLPSIIEENIRKKDSFQLDSPQMKESNYNQLDNCEDKVLEKTQDIKQSAVLTESMLDAPTDILNTSTDFIDSEPKVERGPDNMRLDVSNLYMYLEKEFETVEILSSKAVSYVSPKVL